MSDYKQFILFLESRNNKDLEYKTDKSLAEHSTFRIGGNADIIVFPYSHEAFIDTIRNADEANVRYTVIGNGSNILFSDDGYRGAIICTSKMNGMSFEGNACQCDAGVSLSLLALTALKNSLTGLEWAYGIPGSVGGAVYMNAGAYGGEMSQVIKESLCFDTEERKIKILSNAEHCFSYRHSKMMEENIIILSSSFELKKGDPEKIKAAMDDFMFQRRSKQPLEYPSAGSVFKRYPGYYTARLIDEAGLKGYRVGGAEVSEKHAGFIVNRGGATCRDVTQLIGIIKDRIYSLHGINIETEIRYVK